MRHWFRYVAVAIHYIYLVYSVLIILGSLVELWFTRKIRWLAVGLVGGFFVFHHKLLWEDRHIGGLSGIVLGGFTTGGLALYLFARQRISTTEDFKVSRVIMIASMVVFTLIVVYVASGMILSWLYDPM